MALSQPGPREPEEPSAHTRQQLQESSPVDPAESRSSPQESSPADPAESRSSPQESSPADPAEPPSPPQESSPADPAESRSPPQESSPADPAESRSSPQESSPADPAESRSPPQESSPADPAEPPSPPQESPSPGPAEPRPSAAAGLCRQLRVLLTPLPAAAWPRPQKRLLSPAGTLAPAGKRPCPEPESGPRAPSGSPPGPSSAARGQDGLWDADSDGSDGGDAAPEGHSHLSAYERKRLKNITENAKFFAALKLHELKAEDADKGTPDIKRYQESLSSMVLSEENIRKVVKARVCSMAIHPSESTILVAAGDKWGHIGLWNVSCGTEDGAHIFSPHSFPVHCLHFSPCNPAHLLSLGNDTLRCGDVTKAVFDEICRSEDSFSCFDFLEENASTAIVSHWNGDVAVVDRRTPGLSSELSADIGFTRARTVHVHPLNKHQFLAAGSVDVCVFDVRCLKAKGNKPLSSLTGHTKSVASAYFSPVTGSRVVTVCADDKLRVYNTTSLSPSVRPLSSIRHNNNTGRWLTRFRAIWDPKQEHCFLVGSMAQPRQIQVFQDTGNLLHSFCNVDCLSSVCSINVVHPSQNILVGGNSSGRLHVFK
ncbi:hypothetical protein DUI87_28968 [Hirundo rustica rustica]|uniref:WD repeat-containing protein 76 n=1 Tax=Hirundo rustica rustica TaxID=333673 RepID=A0A3M0J5M0_HIRRU|nr:hypothetical protein DUI87_28968 [Hirundo rustica rustica]